LRPDLYTHNLWKLVQIAGCVEHERPNWAELEGRARLGPKPSS
jgi:hypothetical protein